MKVKKKKLKTEIYKFSACGTCVLLGKFTDRSFLGLSTIKSLIFQSRRLYLPKKKIIKKGKSICQNLAKKKKKSNKSSGFIAKIIL